MKKAFSILWVLAFILFSHGLLSAETIYQWTDENGVQRFSNHPPPEGVEDYEVVQTDTESTSDGDQIRTRDQDFDRLVNEYKQEAQQIERQRRQKEAAEAARRKQAAEEQRRKRIEAEEQRLQEQINAIKNRALGPKYTQGMKQHQIDAIQKQIDRLKSDPEAYFK